MSIPSNDPHASAGSAESASTAASTGTWAGAARPGTRSLRRSTGQRMVAGVAGGVAELLDLDVTLVRIAFVVLALVGGLAVPLYAAAWLLIPEEGADLSIAEDLITRLGWR